MVTLFPVTAGALRSTLCREHDAGSIPATSAITTPYAERPNDRRAITTQARVSTLRDADAEPLNNPAPDRQRTACRSTLEPASGREGRRSGGHP